MKKTLCLAVLAMTLSTPAFAAGDSAACQSVGKIAQYQLRMAKMGINKYEELANDPERITSYSSEAALTLLLVSQTMWDNRKTYNDAKAYKVGYQLCMDMK